MSFDLQTLAHAVAEHGTVCRVVIAQVEGSSPREAGASMLVWDGGQSGTIGGGTLEHEAALAAREGPFFRRVPLGPALGQCCGGAVTLLAERYTQSDIDAIDDGFVLRRVEGIADQPLSMTRAIARWRNEGVAIEAHFAKGWFLEPVTRSQHHIWVWGAGHVGRALITVLSPMPELGLTWIDTYADRFPAVLPEGVDQLTAENPADLVRYAPSNAEHIIVTYSHALDLELCHQLLRHGFAHAGLIGSKTKWARFRNRLRDLGHSDASIARIQCPIGQKALGKHPQAIAIGVTAEILGRCDRRDVKKEHNIKGVG